jgi:hypothetical protein
MKHPGMWDDFFKAGRARGLCLEIDRPVFDHIQAKYFPGGAGTALHDLLAPGIELIDSILGTNFGDCGGCAEREMGINSVLHEPAGDKNDQPTEKEH